MSTIKMDKAKKFRYKKAALAMLNFENIRDELSDIGSECDNIRYFIENDDGTLLNALDGDNEEEFEFRMMFSDLSAKCKQLSDELRVGYVTKHFDDFFVGIVGHRYKLVGFDEFEEDYFNLVGYDPERAHEECGKRLMRLTKEQILATAGQCFGIAISFFDIRYKYDYLKATFDILKDKNTICLSMVSAICEEYESLCEDLYSYEKIRLFDHLVNNLPDKVWLD